jgi:hypothetical protein
MGDDYRPTISAARASGPSSAVSGVSRPVGTS